MKIGKLLLAGVVALGLGLTACNKEDVTNVAADGDGILEITVVPSSIPGTRLSGNLSGNGVQPVGLAAESEIKFVEVWVFAGGNLQRYFRGEPNADKKVQVTGLTVGERSVVVTANTNIGSVANWTTLSGKIAELKQDIADGMVMTAEPKTVTLEEKPAGQCNETSVEVKRVNARVALIGVKTEFEDDAPYNKFVLHEVSMFNVRKESKLFGAPLVSGEDFLYGVQYPSKDKSYVGCDGYAGTMTGTSEGSLAEAFSPTVNVTDGPITIANDSKYFYVNENDATTGQETFIVLKGKLYNGEDPYTLPGVITDADGFTYYKIYINAALDDYTYTAGHTADGKIVRNTQYNLDVTLTKEGSDNIDPNKQTCLTVTVTVAPWTVVTQNVEF